MPKAAPAIASFNGGELSPLVAGRIDLDRYAVGLNLCNNFIPLTQGGLMNRPGTRYVYGAKSNTAADTTRLIPFVYSQDQSYVLEFGNLYFRIYRNRAVVESAGTPIEVVTPWPTSALQSLQFTQSADVLYVCHPSYPPYQIARSSHTSWTCTSLDSDLKDGPFLDDDPGTTTLSVSGVSGSGITMTASASYFTANMVGALFRLWATNIDISNMQPWEPGKSYTSGTSRVYQGGKIYLCAATGTSGTIPPTHEDGSRWDGLASASCKWTFESAFYGVVRVTGYTSATSVTVTVLQRLPQPLASVASARWAEGAWSAENGYPSSVSFFQDRLVFGGSSYQPDTVWFSAVGDYLNFATFNLAGQATSDLSITVTVSSQQVNRIRWMTAEGAGLLIGTEANEFLIAPANAGEGLSQSNIRALAQTSYGSAAVSPVRAGSSTLFVQRAGRQVREAVYDYSVDRYIAPDTTVLASHITAPGIAYMAFAPEPHAILWVILTDGSLRGMTFDRDQQVTAWHRHTLGGTGVFVESVTVIPSPDGARSDAWVCVRRTINGAAKRYIEVIVFDREIDGDIEDSLFLDCSATYDGTATSTITGLAHLNGEECRVIADGYVHPARTPSGGTITLERAASVVHVGLYADAEMETMRIEAGSANGTAQSKTKRISMVKTRVYRSTGGVIGDRSIGEFDRLLDRDTESYLTSAVNLSDEDAATPWPNGYETDGRISIKQDIALPLNILALFPTVETND